MTKKPWEYMSRDEKLDYIKERLDSLDASLSILAKHAQGNNAGDSPVLPPSPQDNGQG